MRFLLGISPNTRSCYPPVFFFLGTGFRPEILWAIKRFAKYQNAIHFATLQMVLYIQMAQRGGLIHKALTASAQDKRKSVVA